MSKGSKENKEKLLQLMQMALKKDEELRAEHKIGDKFRFIRDRLKALHSHVQDNLATMATKEEIKVAQIKEDEIVVYVYIFNAQGLVLKTWEKLVQPAVFYEYSVNRPIYAEKKLVETFIRTRPNKVQHAYLAVVVKKTDILPPVEGTKSQDILGNPTIRVREGALRFDRLLELVYSETPYTVTEQGVLIKKEFNA